MHHSQHAPGWETESAHVLTSVTLHQQRLIGLHASTPVPCTTVAEAGVRSAHKRPLSPKPKKHTWVATVPLCTAADVEEVAAALKLHRLLVVGSSAGATYALALAALLPDRVQATLLISLAIGSADLTGGYFPGALCRPPGALCRRSYIQAISFIQGRISLAVDVDEVLGKRKPRSWC